MRNIVYLAGILILCSMPGLYGMQGDKDTVMIFDLVDEKPLFKGNETGDFREYIAKNTMYPTEAYKKRYREVFISRL